MLHFETSILGIKTFIAERGLKDTNDLLTNDQTKIAKEGANYYFYVADGEVVGFHGVIIYTNKVISQMNYVLSGHRGKGYFKQMLDKHMKLAVNKLSIEATCTKMSIREYLKRGFKPVKQYKEYTKVRLVLNE